MTTLTRNGTDRSFNCFSKTAQDVMMTNPLSICQNATVPDAAEFLTARGISAAPVIDEAGRPVGVLSRADLVRHARIEQSSESERRHATVGDIMTPVVYFVRPEAPITTVIDDLLDCMIHRLFVVDDHGVLIGVISALDVLRGFKPDTATATRSLATSVA